MGVGIEGRGSQWFCNYQLSIWKYPDMNKVIRYKHHSVWPNVGHTMYQPVVFSDHKTSIMA